MMRTEEMKRQLEHSLEMNKFDMGFEHWTRVVDMVQEIEHFEKKHLRRMRLNYLKLRGIR